MFDWHYNYFVKKFNCNFLFPDTDSLVYEIRGVDDIYEKNMKIKIRLILVIIQENRNFMIIKIKKLLVK